MSTYKNEILMIEYNQKDAFFDVFLKENRFKSCGFLLQNLCIRYCFSLKFCSSEFFP